MREQIDVFFSDLAEAAQSGDTEGYTSLFLPDATVLIPHRPPIIGRKEIGEWFDGIIATVVLELDSYEQEQVDVAATSATVRSRGVGHYLVKSTNERVAFDQKYLDVLRFEGEKWLMAYHVASSSSLKPAIWDPEWAATWKL